jgi:predicted NACHT family NTPase
VLELAKLIEMIVGVASPIAKDKLRRNEWVIKLLRELNLDPDHPPADFTAVYQYTLVEYGIGKPKPILELFRQPEIQAIFRQAIDQNNPALLMQAGEQFLASHSLGDQIQTLNIDPKREFYQFAAIFIEIAKRTRTPAEVLTNQRLDSLHRQLNTLQDRLHRLPTLEGIRTELARLSASPPIPPSHPPTLSPSFLNPPPSPTPSSPSFSLAQQIKGWFETLGYQFEPYEAWTPNSFELIIDIPVRRGRYDRILVRGIEGIAELADVRALDQSVATQKVDEGWLVTPRRISPAARAEVAKPENQHLACYTFDELLDQDADFSDYLDWLEAEIQQRRIGERYVPLACTQEELDPAGRQRLAVSHYGEAEGWIDGYIDQWLDDPAKEHVSILGEFGTGKTWFVFHYAAVTLQRYRDAQRRGVERPRLPIVIPLRDYAKAVSVESLFSEFFFRKHEVRSLTYSAFEQLNRMGKLLLIFDGFDEMAARVDRQEMINNFWELAKVVVPGAKVILTCRTEHFPEAREGRALLNAELQASTQDLTGEMPQFEVLELEKFNDAQIRQVLQLQASEPTVEQVMGNPQLLDLARRPVMTELILEALPDIEAGKPVDMSRVYLYAVRRKMERDIKAERTFTSMADKLYFLCELSWEMLSRDRMTINYREFPDRIRKLFGAAVQEEKDLDHWHYDMMGQTMLIRNAEGDYMPAHRSLLEFFVAYKFAAELGAIAPDFLELAQLQNHLDTNAEPKDYTWSDYFRCDVDPNGKIIPIAPLKNFVSESLEILRSGFGQASLTKAVTELLLSMLIPYQSEQEHPLLKIIKATREKTIESVRCLGGNAATLLTTLDVTSLENQDLSQTVITQANLSNANLCFTNLSEANLSNTIFQKILGRIIWIELGLEGETLATADTDGMIRLWETDTCQELLTIKAHEGIASCVTFHPSNNIIASCGRDSKIKLWSGETVENLRILESKGCFPISIRFSPDGKKIAGSYSDAKLRLWDIQTGQLLKTFDGHTEKVITIVFSQDGQTIVSGSFDQTIKFWHAESGQCVGMLEGHCDPIESLAFSLDERLLVSSGGDLIKIWDMSTGECIRTLPDNFQDIPYRNTSTIYSIAFSPEGKTFASGDGAHQIKVWDLKTGKCIKVLHSHNRMIRSVIWHPNGRTIISGSADSTVRYWDVATGNCTQTLKGSNRLVFSVACHSNGKILASAGDDHLVRIWNLPSGRCTKILQGHRALVSSLSLSKNLLASCSRDGEIKLWDLNMGQHLNTLFSHPQSWSIAFNSSGNLLVSTGNDSTSRIWNVQTGECLQIIEHTSDSRSPSALFVDDEMQVAIAVENCVEIWNFQTKQILQKFTGHPRRIRSIAFNTSRCLLASGSIDGVIKFWDVEKGECLNTCHDQNVGSARSLVFNQVGSLLASCDADAQVKLWCVETGTCIRTFKGHSTAVWSVLFSPDEKNLISGSWDGTIKVWDIDSGECIHELINRPYEGMNITGAKGLTAAEIATLKALGAVEDE